MDSVCERGRRLSLMIGGSEERVRDCVFVGS